MDELKKEIIIDNLNDESEIIAESPFTWASSFLNYLVNTGNMLPAWWTPQRDYFLRREVIKNGFLSSAINVVLLKLMGLPFSVQSRDSAVGAHIRLAEVYNSVLQVSLNNNLEKFIKDVLECDNGGFLYVQGTDLSHLPLSSSPLGLRHLDSNKCTRTGNYQFPVIYQNIKGQYFRIHESRIINITQMPSADLEMFGIGLSFVSRCFILAQHLLDVSNYEGESLGSRSSEELIYATSARSEEIKKAFEIAGIESDNAGLRRVGSRVYLGMRDPNAKIGKLMLKNAPEYFDKRDDIEITLTLLAMASGGQSTWFYDSVKSGSTKASAQEATKMGESKLINWWLKKITDELETKFCLPSLRIVAGLEDEDFDGTRSRIKLNSAQVRKINLETNVSNIRVEREIQLQRGELTTSQFETLELSDGRLLNGLPIFALFQINEKTMQDLLYFIPDPLNFETVNWETDTKKLQAAILTAQGLALNGKTILTQGNGRKAFYALLWLEQQYKEYLENISVTVEQLALKPNLQDLTDEDDTVEDVLNDPVEEEPVIEEVSE